VYVKWYPEVKCAGYWKRGICILGVGDLPDLLTRKEFFVNKFELDSQPLAFECIEAWLQQRVLCPAPLDLDFYRRLRFVTSH
jgi:N-acetyllactosaminide beta-1,6-N-acetylglucosaminyltransferase